VYSQQALDAIENYLGLKYQLPKLKLVAMEEFNMGAMENWGLIT
jgi:aminopeptidase N